MENSIKSLTKIYQETSDMIISFKHICDIMKKIYYSSGGTASWSKYKLVIIKTLTDSIIAGMKNFLTNSFSKILDKIDETEIGLRSL
jgi:hypothetical protein